MATPQTWPLAVRTPPAAQVAMQIVKNARLFEIIVTKPLVEAEALNIANYSIAPTLAVELVEKVTDYVYWIHTSRQTEAVNYTVTISNVHDIDGLLLT